MELVCEIVTTSSSCLSRATQSVLPDYSKQIRNLFRSKWFETDFRNHASSDSTSLDFVFSDAYGKDFAANFRLEFVHVRYAFEMAVNGGDTVEKQIAFR